jgi:hypothetical protein
MNEAIPGLLKRAVFEGNEVRLLSYTMDQGELSTLETVGYAVTSRSVDSDDDASSTFYEPFTKSESAEAFAKFDELTRDHEPPPHR